MSDLTGLLLALPVLLVSVVAHEWAHARVAVGQGDPTPLEAGRLTLNPLPHLDPMGSFVVPALLWTLPGSFLFGWAKPVPVRPENFRDRRRGDVLVSLAGVTANFALACLSVALLVAAIHGVRASTGPWQEAFEALRRTARFGILLNLILGVFNLLPVPPLDGSHLLDHVLPGRIGRAYRELGRYSFVLLILIMLVPELLQVALEPVWWLERLALTVASWFT